MGNKVTERRRGREQKEAAVANHFQIQAADSAGRRDEEVMRKKQKGMMQQH